MVIFHSYVNLYQRVTKLQCRQCVHHQGNPRWTRAATSSALEPNGLEGKILAWDESQKQGMNRMGMHGWSLTISGHYSTIPKWGSTCYSCRWHKRRFDSFTPNGGSRKNKVGILTHKKEYQRNREELGLSEFLGRFKLMAQNHHFPREKYAP